MNNHQITDIEEPEGLFEHFAFTVDPGQEPMRIDRWLMHRIAHASRTKIQAAIDAGSVVVNEKPTKNNYKVKPKDHIRILLPEEPRDTEVYPENIPLDIVYEDDDIAIINKPAGLVVHPGAGNPSGTLVNALVYYFGQLPVKAENHRPGLVHRIDKDTSGLLVIGKNDYALSFLGKQFFDHNIHRKYWALVWGDLPNDSGTIKGYLARDPKDRRKSKHFDNPEDGKIAITHYKVIERYHYLTLVECTLETGRTHQIRAHFSSIGHPLFSDEMYGGSAVIKGSGIPKFNKFINIQLQKMPRQALHAKELGFIHPTTKNEIFFQKDLPPDFQHAITSLKNFFN
jgi:23S rRNA pseudouridine1911/1915/1917 synthase